MLQTVGEVGEREEAAYPAYDIGPDEAGGDAEGDEQRYGGYHGEDLGQQDMVGRVDAHDIQSIDLLGDAHGAYLGGDIGAYLTGEDDADDAGGELEQDDLAHGIADGETGHPGRPDVDLDLHAQ